MREVDLGDPAVDGLFAVEGVAPFEEGVVESHVEAGSFDGGGEVGGDIAVGANGSAVPAWAVVAGEEGVAIVVF